MNKHVGNLIFYFNLIKNIIFLSLNAHQDTQLNHFTYFKMVQIFGCYKTLSRLIFIVLVFPIGHGPVFVDDIQTLNWQTLRRNPCAVILCLSCLR